MRSLPGMHDATFSFVDVETTGGNPNSDRITEVGIVRVENGKKVAEFQSLVNPGKHIPNYIQQLTGINQDMVKRAPVFEEIKHEVHELLSDSIFVAHNAAFDYSFIRGEYKRLDDSYRSKLLCTVRLSRALFPEYPNHNLASIIERYGISVQARHRAFEDASALWEFFTKAQKQVGENVFFDTVSAIVKGPRLPSRLREKNLGTFPETSGVYKFFGESSPLFADNSRELLYIGKSTSLKKRIYSHFTVGTQSKLDIELARYTNHIETIQTAGNISAQLLEAELIRKEKPLLNKALKKVNNSLYALQTKKNEYLTIEVTEDPVIATDHLNDILAVYTSKLSMKASLRKLCEDYTLCPKLLGIEPSNGPCFWYQLDKCKGACIKEESAVHYNLRFIEAFSKTRIKPWPYDGIAVLRETADDFEELHLFDTWCYIGHAKKYPEGELSIREFKKQFDWSIYKIVQSLLTKNHGSVKTIPLKNWQEYLQSVS